MTPIDLSRPFSREQAIAAGITDKQLRSRRFRRLLRDVYVATDGPPDPHQRVRAALAVHPDGARASHLSAADLWGVPVPHDPRAHVSVVRARDRRWRPGVVPHLSPPRVVPVLRDGVPTSPPARLLVELALVLGPVDLVVAADALLREARTPRDELRATLQRSRAYGSAAALTALGLARDRVDSAMETRLRLLLHLAGLPEPVVNYEVRTVDGRLLFRLDLAWPQWKVAVEYDGRHHVERVEQWNGDLRREAHLREVEGWSILKVVSAGVYGEPAVTVARVAEALRRRGGFSGAVSEDHELWFPGRAS